MKPPVSAAGRARHEEVYDELPTSGRIVSDDEPAERSPSRAHLSASMAGADSVSIARARRMVGIFGGTHRSATHRRFPRSRPRQRVNPGDSHVVGNCEYVDSLPVFVPRPRERAKRRLGRTSRAVKRPASTFLTP